ncbi:MAG: OB-fold nucleic acid binding domain-containing protein, partial [Thermodesulfobacteriota bacterium]
KAHYPIEFMAASLTSEVQNADKIVKYIAECREMGIRILPPDINESFRDFTVVGDQIRFGLAAVKNVGDAAIEAILTEREERGKYKSLSDFCLRVDLRKVNRRVIESLIKCGAFDFSKVYRSQMLTILEELLEQSQWAQRKKEEAQLSMWAPSQEEKMERYPDIDEFPENQLMAFEKETIGFYISHHPLSRYQEEVKKFTDQDTSTLSHLPNGSEVKLCGLVSGLKEIFTKKGDRMAFLTLEDLKGFVEIILFPEIFKSAMKYLRGGTPIFVRGTLDLSEEQVKIKGTEIRPLSEISLTTSPALHLRIPIVSLKKGQLEQLREILLEHHGATPVFI